jgi:hypothetical protein
MRAFYTQLTLTLGVICLLAACSEEPPPRSVAEFIDEPIMLEAAMVRCLQNRTATRYDAECINARQAAQQIEAKKEATRRVELEAQSESKRLALRRAQQAASKARWRAAENERLREEAEYLAQFGVVPPMEGEALADGQDIGNPTLTINPEGSEQRSGPVGAVLPATDGGNAPMSSTAPEEDTPATDLAAVRDELQRRNDESAN